MQYLYEIKNIVNGKRYIGRTNNIEQRWYRHRLELNNGTHHSIYLQRSWDKYGSENFEFNVIDTRESLEDIIELESSYISDPDEELLNVSTCSDGGDNISQHPLHDEIVEKMTQSLKNRYANMTEDDKQKLSDNISGDKKP